MAIKDDLVKLRLPESMAIRWKAAAAAAGTPSLSEWLRDVADAACLTGLDVPALRTDLVAFRADLARGPGNNLNQIAATLNADIKGKRPVRASEHELALRAAAVEIAAMRARLDLALRPLIRRRP